jgi:hypothetical protein
MHFFLVMAFVLLTLHSSSQDTNSSTPGSQSNKQSNILPGSYRARGMSDSLDSIARAKDADRNISNIVRWQKERIDKEKRQAILRIALGVLFLVVLVVGLMRRTRKAKK